MLFFLLIRQHIIDLEIVKIKIENSFACVQSISFLCALHRSEKYSKITLNANINVTIRFPSFATLRIHWITPMQTNFFLSFFPLNFLLFCIIFLFYERFPKWICPLGIFNLIRICYDFAFNTFWKLLSTYSRIAFICFYAWSFPFSHLNGIFHFAFLFNFDPFQNLFLCKKFLREKNAALRILGVVTIILPLPDPDKPQEHEACCPLCKTQSHFYFISQIFIWNFLIAVKLLGNLSKIVEKCLKAAQITSKVMSEIEQQPFLFYFTIHSFAQTPIDFFCTRTQSWVTSSRLSVHCSPKSNTPLILICSLFSSHAIFPFYFLIEIVFGQLVFAVLPPSPRPPCLVTFWFHCYNCVEFICMQIRFLIFLALNCLKKIKDFVQSHFGICPAFPAKCAVCIRLVFSCLTVLDWSSSNLVVFTN